MLTPLFLYDQANTEVIAGEGLLVTAGAIDCHVHFICPQLAYEAISSGMLTDPGQTRIYRCQLVTASSVGVVTLLTFYIFIICWNQYRKWKRFDILCKLSFFFKVFLFV